MRCSSPAASSPRACPLLSTHTDWEGVTHPSRRTLVASRRGQTCCPCALYKTEDVAEGCLMLWVESRSLLCNRRRYRPGSSSFIEALSCAHYSQVGFFFFHPELLTYYPLSFALKTSEELFVLACSPQRPYLGRRLSVARDERRTARPDDPVCAFPRGAAHFRQARGVSPPEPARVLCLLST